MRSSDKAIDDLGHKLMPRLIRSIVQSVIAAKTGLAEHDINVRTTSGQALIDKAGHEAAELLGPYLREVIDSHGDDLDPLLKDYFESIASGEDQVKALSGLLAGGVQSSLSQVISNYSSSVAYRLNQLAPNLVNDPSTLAQEVASGLIPFANGELNAAFQGLQPNAFAQLVELARNAPSVSDLTQMYNRGLINDDDWNGWLLRLSIPEKFWPYYAALRDNVLTPADAALAVLRGDITEDQGRFIALENGITYKNFDILIANTGEPPGAAELQEALRRGFISEETFKVGIRQSRVRDQWIQTLLDLRYSPLNTADAVNAYVEGYVTEDIVKSIADQNGLEPEQYKILIQAAGDPLSYTDMMRLWRYGKATENDVKAALKRGRLKDDYIDFALALKDSPMTVADAIEARVQGYLTPEQSADIAAMNGLRPEDYEPLYLTAGSPLPKEEMLSLLNRGKATTGEVKDALRQSRLKDSYIDLALELRVRLPALYEVRTLLADGTFTAAQAAQLLLEQGYQSDVVKAIVDGATGVGSSTSKQLTLSMYSNLYQEGAITSAEFLQELQVLGYTDSAALLVQAEIDFKVTIAAKNQVISKVRSAYTSGKINEATAQSDLNSLDMPAETVDRLIADWDTLKSLNIKLLTPAQVTDAWFMNLFNPDDVADNLQQALTYLGNLGYDGPDSILILSIKNKGPISDAITKQQGGAAPSASAPTGSAG
jgi:hypothetical protein